MLSIIVEVSMKKTSIVISVPIDELAIIASKVFAR